MEFNAPNQPYEGELSVPHEEYSLDSLEAPAADEVPESLVQDNDIALGGILQTPEVVRSQMPEAADRALEFQRERENEVKDDASQPVAIGAIVSGAASRQPGLAQMTPPAVEPPIPPQMTPIATTEDVHYKSSLYRQAVLVGFGGAMVLIGLFALYKLFS